MSDGLKDGTKDGAELSTCVAELGDVTRGVDSTGLERILSEANSTSLENVFVEEIPNEL